MLPSLTRVEFQMEASSDDQVRGKIKKSSLLAQEPIEHLSIGGEQGMRKEARLEPRGHVELKRLQRFRADRDRLSMGEIVSNLLATRGVGLERQWPPAPVAGCGPVGGDGRRSLAVLRNAIRESPQRLRGDFVEGRPRRGDLTIREKAGIVVCEVGEIHCVELWLLIAIEAVVPARVPGPRRWTDEFGECINYLLVRWIRVSTRAQTRDQGFVLRFLRESLVNLRTTRLAVGPMQKCGQVAALGHRRIGVDLPVLQPPLQQIVDVGLQIVVRGDKLINMRLRRRVKLSRLNQG